MWFEPVRNGEDFWSNELIIPRSARNTFLSCLSNGLFPQQDGDWSNKICIHVHEDDKESSGISGWQPQDPGVNEQNGQFNFGNSCAPARSEPYVKIQNLNGGSTRSLLCAIFIRCFQVQSEGPVPWWSGSVSISSDRLKMTMEQWPGGWCVSSYIKLRQLRPGVWKKRSNTSHPRHHQSNHLVLLGLAWKRRHRQTVRDAARCANGTSTTICQWMEFPWISHD